MNHGECSDLMVDSARVINEFIKREPTGQFTVMAFAPAQ